MSRSLARSAPRLLAVLPGIGPTGLMYIIKPMLALERQGAVHFRLMQQPYFRPSHLNGVDLVQFCRNVDPRYAAILNCVDARRIPYTYDLDDDLFAVPPGTWDGDFYNDPGKLAMLERYLRAAALVRVYSSQLVERVRPYTPRAVQVSPVVDWALMQPPPLPQNGPVKIVYATSRRDDYLFPIFTPALLELLRRYPGQVALYFWGFLPPEFAGLPDVCYLKYQPDYNRYLKAFAQQGFEIGLAPLLDDPFHRSKTDTKYREYGACSIAGIYSNAAVYASVVQDGQTGLLVENTPEAWLAALVRLVEDRPLRRQIGLAAQRDVRQRYDPQRFHAVWLEHIRQVLSGSPAGAGDTPVSLPAVPIHAARVEAGRPVPLPPGASAGKWTRLRQALQPGKVRAHLAALWWQFKINRLKRV